jgi:signal transduction histidine kinase
VPGGPPETAELGRALNALADRIHGLVADEREHVADLGHRLRTPVTALRLDTDLVEDDQVARRLRGHVDELQRSIDDVVREARRTVREELPGTAEVPGLVTERVAFWQPLAEDQGRRLTLVVDETPATDIRSGETVTVSSPVGASREDVRELVDTLLDNVFGHTPDQADARVVVRAAPPEADGGDEATRAAVVLVVEDAGPGLSRPYLGRGHSATGSTGLGLAIVHRLAETAGGSVRLGRSDLGGLAVTVTLPVRDEPGATVSPRRANR